MIHDSVPFKTVTIAALESTFNIGVQHERQRVLGLLDLVINQLAPVKGVGWCVALDGLRDEIEKGTQQIPF